LCLLLTKLLPLLGLGTNPVVAMNRYNSLAIKDITGSMQKETGIKSTAIAHIDRLIRWQLVSKLLKQLRIAHLAT
jgi:hypothetical protein